MEGSWGRAGRAALVLAAIAVAAPVAAQALSSQASATAGTAGPLAFAKLPPSLEARRLVAWVLRSGDHAGRPFAVVDKRQARLYVFDRSGQLSGETAAILGSTPGDHTVPGVGERAQTMTVGLDERTTPAGRFESIPGRNNKGERIVWLDYESAFAIHRLRPDRAQRARAARLATETPDDNRASWGCVVVPVSFYEQVVEPVLGAAPGVVYVLPETRAAHELFQALAQD